MKAIQIIPDKKQVQLIEVPIPKISKPDDILIKVAYSGICGTDIHIIQGKYPIRQTPPLILGHEFSGTVIDLGKDVLTFQTGDNVAVDPNNSCGSCEACHLGSPHFCTGVNQNIGTFVDGGFAEYIVVPAHMVHKLPQKITLEQGALAEPLSCLAHGWQIIEPLPIGSKILITGIGIIGTLWACVLHLRGHRNVTVCDPNVARLNIIRKLELGFNVITPEELKENKKINNYVFNYIIDCSGYAPIIEFGSSLLEKGGKYCCFGVASPEAEINVKPFQIFINELTIVGVKVNPFSFSKALDLIEALNNRYLDYKKLGIKIYKLDEYEKAFSELKDGTILKAIFVL